MRLANKFVFLSAVGLLLAMGTTHAQMDTKPKNAREFFKIRRAARGSGGAGNGGGEIPNQVFLQGLIGLQYLRITSLTDFTKSSGSGKVFDDALVARILEQAEKVEIIPVEFNLCPLEEDGDCAHPYALKNYPEQNTILVDVRDEVGRWKRLSSLDQRRLATHEFSALAGIEINNHFFSSQIDQSKYLSSFSSRGEVQTYFRLLANLLRLLPGDRPESFSGEWVARTYIRANKYLTSFDGTISSPSYKTAEAWMTFWKSERDPKELYSIEISSSSRGNYLLDERSRRYSPNSSRVEDLERIWDIDFQDGALVSEGERDLPRSFQRALKRAASKYRNILNEPLVSDAVPPQLFCKLLDEQTLICRHYYYHWQRYSPVQFIRWRTEYVFFSRLPDEAR